MGSENENELINLSWRFWLTDSADIRWDRRYSKTSRSIVTKKMISAGVYSLTGAPCSIECYGNTIGGSLEEIVKDIFLAMSDAIS